MKIIKIIVLLIICSFGGNLSAQDANFSQYYASSLYLNPAMAGIEPNLAATANFRQQWRSIVIPYVTSQLSLIYPLYSSTATSETHIGGLGLSVYNDRAGAGNFNTTGVNLNGAYNLYLSSIHSVTFGLQAGVITKKVDIGNLQWGEQYNPYVGSGFDGSISPTLTNLGSGSTYADVSTGAIYSFNADRNSEKSKVSAFVGLSAYHMNRPNESFYQDLVSKLPILLKTHGGVEFQVSERINIAPHFLVMLQSNRHLYNTGLYFNYTVAQQNKFYLPTDLVFGTWYRYKDSFIFSTGIGNDNYTFGFSYDFNTSSLRYNTNGKGAFEISLSVRKIRETKVKRFHTPRI